MINLGVLNIAPHSKPQGGHARIGDRSDQGQRLPAHPVAPDDGVEDHGQRGPEGALAQLQSARVQVRGKAEFEEFTEDLGGRSETTWTRARVGGNGMELT